MVRGAKFHEAQLSAEKLERVLAVAAYLVVRHGDAYSPTFERLEDELDRARRRLGNWERARLVLAEFKQNGTGQTDAGGGNRLHSDHAPRQLAKPSLIRR